MTRVKEQTSFSGGELTPNTHARTDIEKYDSGLKRMVNFFPRIQGGSSTRAGWEHQFRVRNSNDRHHFIDFDFTTELNYTLIFAPNFIRIFSTTGLVLEDPIEVTRVTEAGVYEADSHGLNIGDWVFAIGRFFTVVESSLIGFRLESVDTGEALTSGLNEVSKVFEIPHNYTEEQFRDIKYSQTLDVLTLTHGEHPPREIRRFAHNNWTLTDISFTTDIPSPINLVGSPPSTDIANIIYRYAVTAVGQNGRESLPATGSFQELVYNSEGLFTLTDSGLESGDEIILISDNVNSPLHNMRAFIVNKLGDNFRLEDMEGDAISTENETSTLSIAPTFVRASASQDIEVTYSVDATTGRITISLDNHGLTNGTVVMLRGTNLIYRETAFAALFGPTNASLDSLRLVVVSSSTNNFVVSVGVSATYVSGDLTGTGLLNAGENAEPALSPTNRVNLSWQDVEEAVSYNIYREERASFSFIANTRSNSFTDDNIEVDADINPPEFQNPFSNENPLVVSHHQQRRVFAFANRIVGSNINDFSNFSTSFPLKEDESYDFTLNTERRQELRHIINLSQLVGLSNRSIFALGDRDSGSLNPLNVSSREVYTEFGCSNIRPLVIGRDILYVHDGGKDVIFLSHNFDVDGLDGDSLVWLSDHLFERQEIVDWVYCQLPFYQILCVTDKGNVLSLIYNTKQKVWGWSRFETAGKAETISKLRERTPQGALEDTAYITIEREIAGVKSKRVEKLHSRDFVAREEVFAVDAGSTLNTWVEGELTLSGGNNWSVDEIFNLQGDIENAEIGDVIALRYFSEGGKRVDRILLEIESLVEGVMVVKANRAVPNVFRNATVSEYSRPVRTLSNLEHLEGAEVSILADGSVFNGVVENGSLALPRLASLIHVGLPYTCIMETLDYDLSSETKTKSKIINEVTINYENSAGGEATSEGSEYAEDIIDESGDETNLMLQDGKKTTSVDSAWGEIANVTIRQTKPLPLNILSIIPELDVGNY